MSSFRDYRKNLLGDAANTPESENTQQNIGAGRSQQGSTSFRAFRDRMLYNNNSEILNHFSQFNRWYQDGVKSQDSWETSVGSWDSYDSGRTSFFESDARVRQYLEDNKDRFSPEYYNSVLADLNRAVGQANTLHSFAAKKHDFYSQFTSQEGYDNYLAGQERAAQLEGLDIAATEAELEQLRQELAQREEAMYSRSMVDEGAAGNYDAFAQESRDFAQWQQEQLTKIHELETLLKDAKDYQNYTGQVVGQDMQTFATWSPEEQQALRRWVAYQPGGEGMFAMTQSGIGLTAEEWEAINAPYRALVEKYGQEAVDNLAESVTIYDNAQASAAIDGGSGGFGDFLMARGLGVLSWFTAPVGQLHARGLATGRFDSADPNDWGSRYIQQQQAIDRQNAAGAGRAIVDAAEYLYKTAVHSSTGGLTEYEYELGQWYDQLSDKGKQTVDAIGGIGYQVLANTADNGIRTLVALAFGGGNALAGEIINSGLASIGSFNSTYMEYSQNGYTVPQALTMATIAAATEYLTEKLGFDNLMELIGKGNKKLLMSALRQGLSEMGEETIGYIANELADWAILGQDGGFVRDVQAYRDLGMSDSEAIVQARADRWQELGETALVSGLSGGLAGAGTTLVSADYSAQVRRDRAVRQVQQRLTGFGVDRAQAKEIGGKLYDASEKYGGQADAMRQNYAPGQDVDRYALEFEAAWEMGRNGSSEEALRTAPTFQTLRNTQREIAYGLGKARRDQASQNPKASKPRQREEFQPEYEVNSDGKTFRTDTKDQEEVQIRGFAKVGSQPVLDVGDGKTVSAKDVSYADSGEAALIEVIGKVAGTAENATTILGKARESGISASDYAAGLLQAYEAGRIGYATFAQTKDLDLAGQISAGPRSVAFSAGQRAGSGQANTGEALKKARGKQIKGQRKAGTVHFDREGRSFNKIQETALKVMDQLAKTLGIEFYVYESYEKGGKRVFSDREGNEEKAPNGWYDPSDGSIHIDLNAGSDGKGTMLFTVAHELTHYIKDWSPVKYRTLANLLVEQYARNGQSVQELIDAQKAKAEANGRSLTTEQAFDEVVADSMEAILARGDLGQFMQRVQQRDKTLWQKVRTWFQELTDKLKAAMDAYRDYTPDSPEGRMVEQMEGALEVLQEAFAEGLVDASENYQAAEGQKNTTREGGVMMQARSAGYDYSKPFAQQVDDWLKQDGTFPQNDTLLVGRTPQVLLDIGVPALPVTIAQKNLRENLLGQYRGSAEEIADHAISAEDMKKLPEKLANPVAIIADRRLVRNKWVVSESAIDILVEMQINGKDTLVPIRITGNAMQQGTGIDANVVSSIHGNRDAISRLKYAMDNDSSENILVFYSQKDKTAAYLRKAGYTITSWPNISDGVIHSITDANSPVKLRVSTQTETRQFKNWFGNSTIRNTDNSPKVMYHGSNAQFSSFDRKKARSSGTFGKGFYFTDSATHAGTYGNLYAVYLSIQNPLQAGKASVTREQVRAFLEAVADNEDYSIENYGTYNIEQILRNIMGGKSKADAFRVLQDISVTAIGDTVEAVELFNQMNGTNFDGIVTPMETVAFQPTQIKSATDNVGTFDKQNTNIYLSDRDPTAAATAAEIEKQNEKLKADVANLKELLRLQGKETKGGVFKAESIAAAGNYLAKYASAKLSSKEQAELNRMLKDFYTFLATDKELTWESVQERAVPIARYLQQRVSLKPQLSDYARDVLREIRSRKIALDDIQRAEVEYRYGSYEQFRKSAFGSVTFAKDGLMLDTVWQELADMFPGTFDPDTSAADMPGALMDIIDSMRNSDTSQLEYAYNREMILADITRAVYDSYWRVSNLRTVADKYAGKIRDIRGKHREQMEDLRSSKNDTIASLKAKRREDLERIRQEHRQEVKDKVKATEKRYQESRARAVEGRNKTAMRSRIQKTVDELNKLLLNGDKDRHVPEGLRKAVAEILDAINMEVTSQEDRQRNYERTLARYEQKIRYETDPEKKAMLEAARDAYRDKGDRFKAKMDALKAAYDEIKNDSDPILMNAYSDGLSAYLQTLIVEVGDTPLRDMSLQQLETVYEVCRIVMETIRNANRSFTNARNGSIREQGISTAREVKAAGGSHDDRVGMLDPVRKFLWNNFKPVYAMSRIGSQTLMDAFEQIRNGEDVWALDIVEARKFFLETGDKHGYNEWDLTGTKTFHTPSGIEFRLNLGQMMSIYAYSKRKDAQDHLRLGGIVFDSNDEVYSTGKRGLLARKINTANAYQIGANTLQELMEALTPEQIAFVDDMQRYLSDTMGAKGNEVSMAMYGVKLFRDKNYFPLKSARQYLQELEQPAGEVKLKNSGFTKKTKPGANNPVVLGSFMDVWSKHVNDMSVYHGFTLPLEDFNRIFNYQTPKSEEAAPVSVKAAIQGAYSPAAVQYISQMLTDVNGGARNDPAAGVINRGLSLFKKGAVFASASVVIQQPSAIARAAALIDVKYFTGKRIDPQKHAALWEEAKRYAPVAVIKEMGFFDTSVGKSTQDYITGRTYHGLREQAKALVTDSNFRDEVLSKAPAFADEVAWAGIWNAVKREQADLHRDMDTKSDEFLEICGKRFTDVIVRTQVYDSVLSRSGNMRSKDTGMKMATAFMAEPTTSVNMLADALIQGKRGKKTYARRTVGAVIAAQILNSILVSLVYAGRDDDEEKTFLEKYLASLSDNIWNDVVWMVPSSIPFIRDVVSLAQGYDVERSDMSVISDIVDAFKKLGRDNLTPWQKVEAVIGSVCQLFGLPVKNILRDAKAVFNTCRTLMSGEKSTLTGAGYAIAEGITGKSYSNPQQLYEARMRGDDAHAQRVAARYDTEESADAAVRSAIGDAFLAGEIDEWTASQHLVLYGGQDASEAHWTVDAWIYRRDTGTSDGYGKYNDIYASMLSGDSIDTGIEEFTANGYEEEEVLSNIKKQIGKWYYDDESDTRITRDDAERMLEQYFDMDQDEIESQMLQWDMRLETGFSYNQLKDQFMDELVTEEKALEYLQIYGQMDSVEAQERINGWKFEMEWGFSYDDIRQTYLDNEITADEARQVMMEDAGKTREEADRSIQLWDFERNHGWAYEDRAKLFKRGTITEDQLRSALLEMGDYDREEVELQIEVYRWEMDGHQNVTMNRVEKWHAYCEPLGISKEIFLDVMRLSSATSNDVDEKGKPIYYSAMKKIMAEIDKLPLSPAQKTALAKALGWSTKNINRFKPW